MQASAVPDKPLARIIIVHVLYTLHAHHLMIVI